MASIEIRQALGRSVALVIIDNRARANALNSTLLHGLAEAFGALSREAELRAVVLRGAGGRFVGGADVTEMATLDAVGAREFIGGVHRVCAAIRAVPVPVIAAIEGACLGAGLEIAAACDLRMATETALFGMPEVRLGIPSVVEAALLPMLVGWGRTRWMLLLGETFDAARALEWGLVEEVVSGAELDAALGRWTASVMAGTPQAMRIQKALIRQWEDLPLRAAIDAGVEAFAAAYRTGEPEGAMRGFLERKRAL